MGRREVGAFGWLGGKGLGWEGSGWGWGGGEK